eukprot:1151748-Pelagomonas_calceolata.AAC.4
MKRQPAKLASMVDSALWHNTTGMLAALVDQKLVRGNFGCAYPCMRMHVLLSTADMLMALVGQWLLRTSSCALVHVCDCVCLYACTQGHVGRWLADGA